MLCPVCIIGLIYCRVFKNHNIRVYWFVFALTFAGCKQTPYVPSRAAASASYLPETSGSAWTYRDSIYGQKGDTLAHIYGLNYDTITYVMTSATTDFNSAIYYNANTSSQLSGNYTSYFFANWHKFAIQQPVMGFGNITIDLMVDTASAGYSWTSIPTQTRLLNGYPVRLLNTILEKDITKTVKGKSYENVVHTGVNMQIYDKNRGWQSIAYYNIYIAKGIGMIERDANVYNNYDEFLQLLTYNIAK